MEEFLSANNPKQNSSQKERSNETPIIVCHGKELSSLYLGIKACQLFGGPYNIFGLNAGAAYGQETFFKEAYQ